MNFNNLIINSFFGLYKLFKCKSRKRQNIEVINHKEKF